MTLRAIIWCAVSTEPQANEDEHNSMVTQEHDGRSWCTANSADIVDVLRVPGHSREYKELSKLAADARAKHIDAFDRLIDHLEACDFDVLWVRDTNRFARKPSLLHYIIESIIEDCGARIYSQVDGWIDAHNADMFAAMHGYKTAKEMKWLRESSQWGKDKNAERGLPTGAYLVMSHLRVRDEKTGKTTAVIVNESLRRLFDDLASALLAGVGWNSIGDELFQRYGHVDASGRPYSSATLYAMVFNPQFWGHTYRSKARLRRAGRWVFDEDCQPPEGYKVWRNTIPPVYAGEQAEQVKAELRRRSDMRGTARPSNTYRFSGLFVCGVCGSSMVVVSKRGKRTGLRCKGSDHKGTARRVQCANGRLVRGDTIQAWLDDYLRRALDTGVLELGDGDTDAPDDFAAGGGIDRASSATKSGEHLALLEVEIAGVEKQIETMIAEQSFAPIAVQPMYRQRVSLLSEQLEALRGRFTLLRREMGASADERRVVERAFEEIRDMTLEHLWRKSDREINQILRRLLTGRKLVIRDRQITRIVRVQ